MAKELFARNKSNVIPFDQDGEFFYRKACKYVKDNRYIDALNFYRKAVEKEPENIDYMLDLAEVFTEMTYFDESNKLLFSILENDDSVSDCYFGLGCNFLGLQEYDKAEECFEKYLDRAPNGVYYEDAKELLEILRDEQFYLDVFDEFEFIDPKIYKMASKGKVLLDDGEYEKAARQLQKVLKLDPTLVFAKNNLALAYFCMSKLDRAIELSKEVLDVFPSNVHANCNMAIFLQEKGDSEGKQKYTNSILNLPTDDVEDLHKMAVTLCELKEHQKANIYLKMLLQYKPYDVKILHYTAVSAFNLRRFREAMEYWDKVDKLSPYNTISNFYKRYTQNLLRYNGEFKELPYGFQVPYEEVVFRVKKINEIFNTPKSELKEKWESNDSLKALLIWGLELNDDTIKRAILNTVASFGDQNAERFLRDFILRRDENKDLKKDALTMLKQIGAKEPYIAYVDDNIVEVKVNIIDMSRIKIPKELQNIADFTISNMEDRYSSGYQEQIKDLWVKFIKAQYPDKVPRIRKKEAWAAALELYYCMKNDIKISKGEIIDYYGISYKTLDTNYKKLVNVLEVQA
ncbi:tetratricopeptide repeat protein [Xylanivirga thermophila]|uniref:tetratricopeptide repeat protein n=1 Tax=Xylanivirga thermophila TaxID=2496273 RepID=UPI00101DA024|nr:tetratricopeptide repeat protein [Xylanivirga thermophila]